MPRLERVEFSQSQDAAPPPQQAAVVPDRKTVTPLPASEDSGKRKIPLGGNNKQSSSNTQQKKKAKTQKKKKEKDPNHPKKKKNAYDFWVKKARSNLPPNNTDMHTGIWQAKQLGEQWRAMSKQDKAPYERMASQDNIRWQEEMKVYKEANSKNNGPDEKKTAAKNVEGTIQLASMQVVSNPAVEGQKALARAMGKEDTKKNSSNAKGTTTDFINAKVVNNNSSNDAPLPTAASQKSIESVDVDILVDDPSHEEEKLMKVPIKKGSSITTNNGNKENNNNGSSKAAAGKEGGLMASAKSGGTRLFNKGKYEEQTKSKSVVRAGSYHGVVSDGIDGNLDCSNIGVADCGKDTVGEEEGGMDKVDGKDGEQKVRSSMLFMCFVLSRTFYYILAHLVCFVDHFFDH